MIIYKYLKEQMFPKAHVTTTFLSVKFATTSSTLHKYIIGMKYKGGVPPGTKYRQGESEEWTNKQREDNINRGACGSGTTSQEPEKGKGAGKKTRKTRDAAEIWDDTSKPKKKRRIVDDDDDDEDEDRDRPLKAPVTAKGLIIPN